MWEVLYIVLALVFLLLLYGLIRALLVRDRTAAPVRPLNDAALAEIDQLVQRGRKIEAIKTIRDHTALPLAQAKERIEAWDIAQERRAIGRRAAPPPTSIPDEE